MTDISFRGADVVEPNVSPEVEEASNEPTTQKEMGIEGVPFTLYWQDKGESSLGEYFGISKDKSGPWKIEFTEIETYFKDKIERGDMENSTEAVSGLLKEYEKKIGLDKFEPTLTKIPKILAYLEFRRKIDDLERGGVKQ